MGNGRKTTDNRQPSKDNRQPLKDNGQRSKDAVNGPELFVSFGLYFLLRWFEAQHATPLQTLD